MVKVLLIPYAGERPAADFVEPPTLGAPFVQSVPTLGASAIYVGGERWFHWRGTHGDCTCPPEYHAVFPIGMDEYVEQPRRIEVWPYQFEIELDTLDVP